MPVMPTTTKRSRHAEICCSDIACWAGLVVIWELLVILIGLWVVPVVLTASAASGPLLSDVVVIGAGA